MTQLHDSTSCHSRLVQVTTKRDACVEHMKLMFHTNPRTVGDIYALITSTIAIIELGASGGRESHLYVMGLSRTHLNCIPHFSVDGSLKGTYEDTYAITARGDGARRQQDGVYGSNRYLSRLEDWEAEYGVPPAAYFDHYVNAGQCFSILAPLEPQ